MSECSHTDRRRAKRVIDEQLHILCDDCFARWDVDLSPQIHALPPAPLDPGRLAADLYELWRAHMAHEAAKKDMADAARAFRAHIWALKWRYSGGQTPLTWQAMADALGVGRQRLQLFASYNKRPQTKGEPEYVFRPVREIVRQRQVERATKAEERHRAALRSLGIARGVANAEPYDITEYADRGSSPEQGDHDEHEH